MKSKLIILGCGSSVGVPRIDGVWGNCNKNNPKNLRTRCSAIIIKGSNSILIDTSPDIKNQFNKNKITQLSSVIFTHDHADQTNGLFELRPFFWKNKSKINIYGHSQTINSIKKRHDFCFKTIDRYPAMVNGKIINLSFTLGRGNEKINFKTLKLKHGNIKSTAYVFENTAYVSDCNDLSIVKKKELKNLKYLIIDCLKFLKHPTHFNLNEVIYVHKKLSPKTTVLTNMHHDLDYKYLSKNLPKNIIPAYDGLNLNL
jgi:phosphoribosyl 1,2-cyclic phosphate phosphodiesterase